MAHPTRLTLCTLTLLGLLISSPPGLARGAPVEASAADKKQAKALFVQGSKEYQAGRYKAAITIFEKAYRLWQNPRILLNIAICHLEGGDLLQAVRTLRKALASLPEDKREAFRKQLPPKLVAADKRAGKLTVRMPGEGVTVTIDGKAEGSAPLTVVLLAGKHDVRVSVGGEEKARKSVEVQAGATAEWVLAAWPVAERPRPRPEPTPKAGNFGAKLRKLQRLPIWYFGAAAVLALAGGITVIATGIKTNQLEDDYFANPNLDTRDSGIRYRNTTNAMIGVTVTAAVAAGVLALFTDWKNPFGKKERAAQILPQVGPHGSGVVLSGTF